MLSSFARFNAASVLVFISFITLDDLNINENVLRGVYSYGFEKPSVIQNLSIPKIIEGKDIIAQAQSGTGKTGAITVGALSRINESIQETQLLVLVPTRELADQVYTVIKEISNYTKITSLKVVGGTSVMICRNDLNNIPHVIVGTPGRVLDMIIKNYLITEKLNTHLGWSGWNVIARF